MTVLALSASTLRWLLLVSSVATFLVAAKAHGRQLRLEREAAGYHEVHFGGRNPPFVEALWHRERVRFWSVAIVLGLAALAYAWLASRAHWPRPLLDKGGSGAWLSFVVPPFLWSPTIAFSACGIASWAHTGRAVRASMTGTIGWWSLTVVLVVAIAVLATRKT